MEEKTARELIRIISDVKGQQEDIWKKLVGDPTEGKNGIGIISRLDKIEDKVDAIEKNGVRLIWFGRGVSAAVGAGAYAGIKSSWFGKAIATLFGAGAADKMIK